MMDRVRRMYRKRRILFFAVILIALLLVDAGLFWYTSSFTTDEKKGTADSVSFDLIDVQRTSGGALLLVSEDGAFSYSGGNLISYEIDGSVNDASVGYYTGAVAASTKNGSLHYFEPGEYSSSFSVAFTGNIEIIGISEMMARQGVYVPEEIVIVVTNATGTRVLVLSVANGGNVEWAYDLASQVVAVSKSDYARSFLVALDNNTVFLFKLIQTTPRTIYHLLDPVREVQLAPSGLTLAILYGDDPSHLAMFSYSSTTPIHVTDLPSGCKNLQIQKEGSLAYVQCGNDVIEVLEGSSSLKTSIAGLIGYVVPTVSDSLFTSTPGKITSYKGHRSTPLWETVVGNTTAHLITDAGGNVLVGWWGRGLIIIDNSQQLIGSRTALLVVGVLVIIEALILPIAIWWKRLSHANMKTAYVLIAGILIGIVVTTISPDPVFIEMLGGLSVYILVVATMSAISTLAAWSSQAGLASIVIGFAVGLVISIPICLVSTFIIWASGIDISSSDFIFRLLVNGLAVGFKVGAASGIAGYLLRWIFT
jgi:hypothetical protein